MLVLELYTSQNFVCLLLVSVESVCIVHRTVWLDITNQFSLVITRLDALESFQFGDIYIYWGEERERMLTALSLLFPDIMKHVLSNPVISESNISTEDTLSLCLGCTSLVGPGAGCVVVQQYQGRSVDGWSPRVCWSSSTVTQFREQTRIKNQAR